MDRLKPRPILLVYLSLALVGAGLFLFQARQTYRLGFPLDDAWIHQTYARNWAQLGEWAFTPGTPSSGSTAPLWTAALALGYALGVPHLAWSYLLGMATVVGVAWTCHAWMLQRLPAHRSWAILAGILVLGEWHLIWSGLSGMETAAAALIALLTFWLLDRGELRWIGLVIGAGIWLRPDAALLLLPVAWHLVCNGRARRRRMGADLLWLGAGLLLSVLPYLVLNRTLSGTWWPNTFYAKSAEYRSLTQIPLLVRLLAQFGVPAQWLGHAGLASGGPLVGPLLVLLPGMALSLARSGRQGRLGDLAPALWIVAHAASYALRLPPTYQHGRYALPIIPVALVLGLQGMHSWVELRSSGFSRRLLSRAWALGLATTAFAFLLVGGQAYAVDVAIIESEMVGAASWIGANTPSGSLIAAHDIGALGYFGQRPLLDLAGVVSPEVIPFIRDEGLLAQFLSQRHADYLMTFPSWYPQLTDDRQPVHTTVQPFSPAAGGENMAVYRWETPMFAP